MEKDIKDKTKLNVTFHDRFLALYEEARDTDFRIGRNKFAEQCGISIGKVNGYLNCDASPSPETLKIIAKHQRVSVSWLVGETDCRQIEASDITKDMPKAALDELVVLLNYLRFKYKY